MKKLAISKNKLFLSSLIVFILFMSLLLTKPGIFSIDEASIILTFDGLSRAGGLEIHNNYNKYKSDELNAFKGHIDNGKVYGRYPPLYFYIGFMFFRLMGVYGLIYLNVLSTILSIVLLYKIFLDMTGKLNIAYQALSLLLFATFFLQYSLAIWPHMLNLAIILSAIYLYRMAVNSTPDLNYHFFYIGLLLGIAVGVRLTSGLMIIILFILIVLERDHIPKRLALISVGLFTPLGLISYVNLQRFGELNPFAEYPGSFQKINMISLAIPFAILIIVIGLTFTIVKLKKYRINSTAYGELRLYVSIAASALLTIAGIFILIENSQQLIFYFRNFLGYIVNSWFIPGFQQDGAQVTDLGLFIYNGIYKKALLQSCPFFVIIFCYFFFVKDINLRNSDKRLIGIIVIVYPLFYSLFHFHGGMGYNLRYFIELLPWGALVTVLAFRNTNLGQQVVEVFVLAMVFFALILTFSQKSSVLVLLITMVLPTILALGLFTLFLLQRKYKKNKTLSRSLGYFLIVSIALGFSVTYFQDIPATLYKRSESAYKSDLIVSALPDNSFLFVYWGSKDSLATAKLEKNITIADYSIDKGKDFFRLLDINLERRIPVFLYGDGVHPELIEILKIEYELINVSEALIPIYKIQRANLHLDNLRDISLMN